tara:strand:+ start:559 stop:1965 length:1407 start_codon:yes stop_codon:yes gene_type:complete
MQAPLEGMQKRPVNHLRTSDPYREAPTSNDDPPNNAQNDTLIHNHLQVSSYCDVSVAPFWDICSIRAEAEFINAAESRTGRGVQSENISQPKILSADDAARILNGTEYLPAPRDILRPLDATSQSYMDGVKTDFFKSFFDAHPQKARTLNFEEYGFGSMVHGVIAELSNKLLNDKTKFLGVRFPKKLRRWTSNSSNEKGDLFAFFDFPNWTKSTKVPEENVTMAPRMNTSENVTGAEEQEGHEARAQEQEEEKAELMKKSKEEQDDLRRFLEVIALESTLMVPRRKVMKQVEHFQQKVGWLNTTKVVGLHIRGGDSCLRYESHRTKRSCDSLQAFIPNLTRVQEMYEITHVFVATDEAEKVIEQARSFPNFNWLISADRRAYQGDDDEKVVDAEKVGQAYLRDLELLSRADVLLGRFTSNLDRLALELRVGRQRAMSPFISQDAPWCFAPMRYRKVTQGKYAGKYFMC